MKKIYNYLAILITGVLLTLMGCQEEKIDEVSSSTVEATLTEPIPKHTRDQIAYDVAQRLASSISLPEVRSFIKMEALKQVDGDYDILFVQALNKPLTVTQNGRTESTTFGQLLASGGKNERRGALDLDHLRREYPLLQITVANIDNANAETWNADREVPLIAYKPKKIKNDVLPAYDSEGNYVPLSATTPPENQVVVVLSPSERIMAIDKDLLLPVNGRSCPLQLEPLYEEGGTAYVLSNDYFEASNNCRIYEDDPVPPKKPTTITCDRDRRTTKDQVVKMKFRDLTAFRNAREGWFDNYMEIQCIIFFGNTEGELSSLIKPLTRRETDFKDCGIFSGCDAKWVGMNSEIVTWAKDTYGDRMKYQWIEHDTEGDNFEQEISFSAEFDDKEGEKKTITAKGTYTFNSEDYQLGSSMVEYCDNTDGEGKEYRTPDLLFYVNQE